ncbi:MAG: DUF2513 domain-containing protein [Pseudomonadota bacterium]
MKRDMDLIREMLLWMEEHEDRIIYLNEFSKFPREEELTLGHLRQLISGGFVEILSENAYGITWEGHEFLEKIRDPEVWRKTKEGASKLNSWGVKLLGEIATGFIKAKAIELGLPLQ